MKKLKIITEIYLLIIGLLLAAAGVICLINPLTAVTSAAWLVGLILLISGIISVIYFMMFGKFLMLSFPIFINALADILFGIVFLQHPDATSRVVTFLFGIGLIAFGFFAALVGLIARRFVEGKGVVTGVLIFGVICIALGVLALNSSAAGAAMLAIPVGLFLVAFGIGHLILDYVFLRSVKAGKEDQYFKDVEA